MSTCTLRNSCRSSFRRIEIWLENTSSIIVLWLESIWSIIAPWLETICSSIALSHHHTTPDQLRGRMVGWGGVLRSIYEESRGNRQAPQYFSPRFSAPLSPPGMSIRFSMSLLSHAHIYSLPVQSARTRVSASRLSRGSGARLCLDFCLISRLPP